MTLKIFNPNVDEPEPKSYYATQFACPNCGLVAALEHFDVLGAADGNLICPDCGLEHEMVEVLEA